MAKAKTKHDHPCPFHQALDRFEAIQELIEHSDEARVTKLFHEIEKVIAGTPVQEGIPALFFALDAQMKDLLAQPTDQEGAARA